METKLSESLTKHLIILNHQRKNNLQNLELIVDHPSDEYWTFSVNKKDFYILLAVVIGILIIFTIGYCAYKKMKS